MSRPTVDQASKQNIGDSEFVNLVVSMTCARYSLLIFFAVLMVNLCEKLLFLHQLTHNMTIDCLIEFQDQTRGEHIV